MLDRGVTCARVQQVDMSLASTIMRKVDTLLTCMRVIKVDTGLAYTRVKMVDTVWACMRVKQIFTYSRHVGPFGGAPFHGEAVGVLMTPTDKTPKIKKNPACSIIL